MKYFVCLELLKDEVIEAKSKKEAIKKLLKETTENWSEDDFYLHAMKYEDFLDLEGREEWFNGMAWKWGRMTGENQHE